MRQQDRQINDDTPDVIKSEPVPVPAPGGVESRPADSPDGRHHTDYPSGTADHGPEDALDERGSYDNDPAPSGPWSGDPTVDARTRDQRRGGDRLPEERAEDDALDDDALAEHTPADRTADPDRDDDRGTSDRGDLADASQADAGDPTADADRSAVDAAGSHPDPADRHADGTDPADSGTDLRDDADEPADDDPDRSGTRNRPEFHEPAPLPTTFGATTVGGAVAASALAGSHRDAREEDTVRSGDGPADDRIDGVGDEPERDQHPTRAGDEDRSLGAADAATGQRTDGPDVDRGSIDGVGPATPVAVGTSHPVNPDILSAGNPDATAGAGPGPEAGSTAEAGTTPDGELLPGAAPAEPIVAILSPDTVQGLRDRWREVQLRFVDDPPGATADAHRLVEESVEAVTAALTQQREELGGWQRDGATDTEQLRMVVRRHRDFLDRLLGK